MFRSFCELRIGFVASTWVVDEAGWCNTKCHDRTSGAGWGYRGEEWATALPFRWPMGVKAGLTTPRRSDLFVRSQITKNCSATEESSVKADLSRLAHRFRGPCSKDRDPHYLGKGPRDPWTGVVCSLQEDGKRMHGG